MTFKHITKRLLSGCSYRILSLYKGFKHKEIVYNVNSSTYGKRCLFLYITEPFCTKELSDKHQNQWQAKEIARIIGSRGFVVDVADYQAKSLKLKKMYDLVIGLIPRGIDVYSTNMNPGCLRIAYLTSMNLAVTTKNERIRLNELKKRRGVTLSPRRGSQIVIEDTIEQFDGAWYIGNEYNYHSYDCFKMPPVFYIKNSGYSFPWSDPSVARDPHCFLYFGSYGQVHKGLDLLLELFSQQLTNCTLYVCGTFAVEEDFNNEYQKELYQTSNIISLGFVDIHSEQFREVTQKCAYSLLPSCAEGCAGSVLTTMSAGLISIVSRECGFEDDEVINLPDCSKDTLFNYLTAYSLKDAAWICEMSSRAINIVKDHYSKSAFTKSVEKAIDGVLNAR